MNLYTADQKTKSHNSQVRRGLRRTKDFL